MTSILDKYVRVTRARKCPICQRPDWCLIARDGSGVICARVTSTKRMGEAGWLHGVGSPPIPTRTAARPAHRSVSDLSGIADRCEAALSTAARERFAASLGLTAASLALLAVGWMERPEAWTFPMRDADMRVIGIRLRLSDGRKLSVRGGHEGCFIPRETIGDMTETVIICEGPTDTAAILDAGLPAIGRPSCRGGVQIIRSLLKNRDAVIFADDDGPGRDGANALAEQLVKQRTAVRIVCPPRGNDVREWKPTRRSVEAVISSARYWTA